MSLRSRISIPPGRDLIEVNGACYKYSKLMSQAVVWPVIFDETYGGRLMTQIRGQHHLHLRSFRGVRMVLPDGGDTERGIVGGVIGENVELRVLHPARAAFSADMGCGKALSGSVAVSSFIMVNPRLRIAALPARREPSGTQGNPIVVEDDLTPIPQFSDNRPTIAFLTS
ncbi:hypothetical protein BC629DRAFT_1444352 [Irpex lacteus]|nr:hypothetical protein BC629DRAFT_1444352 [Irpex lacteus]